MVKSAQLDEPTHKRIIEIQDVLMNRRITMTISEILDYATRYPDKIAKDIIEMLQEEKQYK